MSRHNREAFIAQFIQQVRQQLIVSCQALPGEPLFGADIMARMAIAAQQGGAKAIRANSISDIQVIRKAVDLPILGLFKDIVPNSPIYITPTLEHAIAVAQAGADIIAIDATNRPRPAKYTLAEFVHAIHEETGLPVMADIAIYDEGLAAEDAGADLVSTTMSGYTDYSSQQEEPDLELVGQLAKKLRLPLIAEGRYRSPEHAIEAIRRGATAVVVGGAITRPQQITRWFVDALNTIR